MWRDSTWRRPARRDFISVSLGVTAGVVLTRGVTAYVIDPEGEYADMTRAAAAGCSPPACPVRA